MRRLERTFGRALAVMLKHVVTDLLLCKFSR